MKARAWVLGTIYVVLCSWAGQAMALENKNLEVKDCSSSAAKKIDAAVTWLRDNITKVDQKMGKNNLMDWPGKSRKKFLRKLDKKLKFVCRDERNVCTKKKWVGHVVPILHQKRVALCTNLLSSQADYVRVIAHEISHLVRLNKHRRKCEDKYKKPRFSQSLGMAASHAYKGTNYNSASYIAANC